MTMTKAEANITSDVKTEDATPARETLKLNPELKGTEQPSAPPPSNPSLFNLESMSVEEKEQKAKEWGYIPKDQFRGDQSRHIGTDEFLKISEQRMPALKNQVRKQDDIIASLRAMNEGLNENMEQQKADIAHQMREASDNQDLLKFRALEKRDNALEQKRENMQANLANLENNHQQDVYSGHQEDTGRVVNQWIDKPENQWLKNPTTDEDFKKKGFVDHRFTELSKKYPDANPTMIMNQIDADLNKFTQPAAQSYGYNPGGNNPPMGQPPSKDKTRANLTIRAEAMLTNSLLIARTDKERERFTKNYLNNPSNDGLFKWDKSNN